MLVNLSCIVYVGSVRPFELRKDTKKELINEAFIQTLTIILVLFTDFVNNDDFKYDIGGWGYCLILSMCIVYNFYALIIYIAT